MQYEHVNPGKNGYAGEAVRGFSSPAYSDTTQGGSAGI
jgi:hypothetical protein